MSDDGQYHLFEKDMPLMDGPAFVRRAREVEAAWNSLIDGCARERARLLEMPRLRLARLFALMPSNLDPSSLWSRPGDAEYLRRLQQEWQPQLRSRVKPKRTAAELQRAVAELGSSFARFNRLWIKVLNELDLSHINRLRENYNRHFLLEKECALRSTRVAREGFQPLEPLTVQRLLTELPLLEVPERRQLIP